MICKPVDVLEQYPVRKSRSRKAAFRKDAAAYLKQHGYSVQMEKGAMGARNLIAGDPETAEYLVTAHYDTCSRLPFPNFSTPCSLWGTLGFQLLIMLGTILLMLLIEGITALITHNWLVSLWVSFAILVVLIPMMLIGPANPSNANDNTSGVVALLTLAGELPESCRGKVCFVLFDLEEAGLIGSASYRKRHKEETAGQLIINLDCVGDGDELWMFPTGGCKRKKRYMQQLRQICGVADGKSLHLRDKGFCLYPSDQRSFPYGVGIAALRKSAKGMLYLSKIHTSKDRICEMENINFLCDRLKALLSDGTVQ